MAKGSAPSAPDPYTSAAAQYQYGTEAADYGQTLNDVNTVGPTGSTSYAQTGVNPFTGAPITTQTTTLSPIEQQLLSGSQSLQYGLQDVGQSDLSYLGNATAVGAPQINPVQYGVSGKPIQGQINTSGVPALDTGGPIQSQINTNGIAQIGAGVPAIANVGALEQQGQATALAGEEAALQPIQSQELEQTKAQLINSGNLPGSPAYENAMAQLNSQLGQQDTQAAGAAITAGTGLQSTNYGESANTNSQLFGEGLSANSQEFGQSAQQLAAANAAQQQAFGESATANSQLFGQAAQEQAAANTAQQQGFGEAASNAELNNTAGTTALADWAQQTGVPLNELQAILGGSQVNAPSAVAPTSQNVSAPDIMSAFQNQYAGQLSNYNAGVATQNSLLGDATTLGALSYLAFA